MPKKTNGLLLVLGEIAVTTAGTPSVGANTVNAFDFQNVFLPDGTRGNRSLSVANGGSVVLPGVYRDAIVNAFNLLGIGQATPGGSPNLGGYIMGLQQSNEAPFVAATLSNSNHTTFRTLHVADPTGVAEVAALEVSNSELEISLAAAEAELAALGGGETPGAAGSVTVSVNQPVNNGATVLAALSGIVVGQMIGRGVPFQQNEEE